MIKKIIAVVILLLMVPVLYLCTKLGVYFYDQHKSLAMTDFCYKAEAKYDMETKEFNDPNSCYAKMFNLIVPYFLLYKVTLKDVPELEYEVIDNQSDYYVPTFIPNYAEAMISYGIGRTCSFEDNYIKYFNKPVYAYDCGNLTNICEKANFESQCVETDKNATSYTKKGQVTGHPKANDSQIHYYGDKIRELGLSDKKIYLKMNIVGAEDKVMDGILEYSDNIPVISVYVHFKNPKMMVNKLKTLNMLNEKYYLVARVPVPVKGSGTEIKSPIFSDKYISGYWSRQFALTYINKNLVKDAKLTFNQDDTIQFYDVARKKNRTYKLHTNINWIVVLAEMLRQKIGISYE